MGRIRSWIRRSKNRPVGRDRPADAAPGPAARARTDAVLGAAAPVLRECDRLIAPAEALE